MEKAAEYLQHAEDAERAAEFARDDDARELYRRVARRWRQTAEEAERQRWWTYGRRSQG